MTKSNVDIQANDIREPLVTYRVDENSVAWLTLNRPHKRNAMSRGVLSDLQSAYERYAADDSARCAVLTGAGRAFSTGGDITMFPAINAEVGLAFTYTEGQPHYRFLDGIDKPVIAAVHGNCLAGGFELALQCTFIFASADATFGMEETRLGLLPGYGGTTRLLTAGASRLGAELLLTARRISAREAERLGVVNAVLDDQDALLRHAGQVAATIAAMSPQSTAAILHVLRATREGLGPAFDVEALRTALLFGNADTQQRIGVVLASLNSKAS